jgi:hypothetical protein
MKTSLIFFDALIEPRIAKGIEKKANMLRKFWKK